MSVHKRSAKGGSRYDVRLRDPDGRPYKRTFATRQEAKAFEGSELHAQVRGVWIDPRAGKTTFAAVAAEWLEANPAKRSSTYARDETIVRRHLDPVFARRAIASIRPADVQALVNGWAEEEAAPRTIRRQFGVLRAILAFALARDLIGRSPCRNVKLPAVAPNRRAVITPEELVTLAAEMGEHGAMAYVAAMTGLRWGEVAGLRVRNLDILGRSITVAEQVTRGVKGRSAVGPPKSEASRRTLAISTWLAEMLSAHLSDRGLTGADSEAFVFSRPDGQPLAYANWRRAVWAPACARAGIEKCQFHDLRRTNATALVAEGVDIKTAQTRLGHSDVRLTLDVYAQAVSSADRSAADVVGARFAPPANDRRRRRTSTDVP
ncbi:MAG: hypothetical protein NVSMB4_08270 [Acidimicrobiales bacterium]